MTAVEALGLTATVLAALVGALAAKRVLLRLGVAAAARLASAGACAATVLLVVFAAVAAFR